MSIKPLPLVRPLSKPLTNSHILSSRKPPNQDQPDPNIEEQPIIPLTPQAFIDTYTSLEDAPFPQFRFFSLKKSYEQLIALVPLQPPDMSQRFEKAYKQAQILSTSRNLIDFFINSEAISQKLENFDWRIEDFANFEDQHAMSASVLSFLQQNWDDAVEADLFLEFYGQSEEQFFAEKAEFGLLGFQDEDAQFEVFATFAVYCFVFGQNGLKFDVHDGLYLHRWLNAEGQEELVGVGE
ncbi:hypothetical protein SS50377_20933 [Spironucleus salmonicida]|uniref:Uncharacterized protein n=1 Tax=Spironucleus salmonicida TaxID=348837 RepID=V6LIQ7_9EUKA|nr:hypothetical protein SS50377_20933 [Spironucleus salmonicida]|eukprot:EST43606.1 Hypothetical protein SS50377_16648 [Spironucleus salmonicida]